MHSYYVMFPIVNSHISKLYLFDIAQKRDAFKSFTWTHIIIGGDIEWCYTVDIFYLFYTGVIDDSLLNIVLMRVTP